MAVKVCQQGSRIPGLTLLTDFLPGVNKITVSFCFYQSNEYL
ncbi:hypothetical protein BACCOPRO_00589 [Phocaeicola coprophilus DSM 18228 = JCM 13818]|uniref:Uncharacterized protein n=1 Tax=Phocaeicola coprophilus DSM 18228 = JCM 13818 TaxID=547042 RepID=S0F9B4_9BACT|nr:hypothetical protein BACCOPRO_00589 [Phocaeicola coprophilus DSM 18228 = JCM 13818]DAU53073.1 MAG TPA: hypothetical protein [Caudoviricetes sp.]